MITFPRCERDLLIEQASRSWAPDALVLFWLSEPARSTRLNCAVRTRLTPL